MAQDNGRPAAPTISAVAQLAGVSRAVASRALSTEKRPVSADKRERVIKAAEALGYKPNLLAQSLTKKTVNLVAVAPLMAEPPMSMQMIMLAYSLRG